MDLNMLPILYSLKSIHEVIKKEKPSSVWLVTSGVLQKKLNWAIKEIGIPSSKVITIPDGEKAKEWQEVEKLLKKFIKMKLDRKSLIIALGGGAVGDMVGFAASIYLRGIKYIQVPTTLLAQVDSAHGGKTGINFLKYKNQIGSFYLPQATIIDTRFISSLSKNQIIEGVGEIIKAGFIKDSLILNLLKKETVSKLSKSKRLEEIIKRAINVKLFYIKKDYKDNNVRQILNVGHTFGHAIELKYKIGHGLSVLIGMLEELEVTEKLKLTPLSVRKNLIGLLKKLGIGVDLKMKAEWEKIIHDKKIIGDSIVFPIIVKTGKSKLVKIYLNNLKSNL